MDNLHRQHEWAALYPYQPVIPEFGVVDEEAWPARTVPLRPVTDEQFADLPILDLDALLAGLPPDPWSEVK